ncbi:MAG: hypothetical protein Q9227_003243 [Pyrenula ochraceoflavens]
MNPELRQTLHTISRNLESANETAQENIYTFSQHYVDPCLASAKSSIQACVAPCFPSRDDRLRRRRARSRGRAELSFDFYDDWEDEEESNDGFMGWGNDELDRLLAGNRQSEGKDQPRRQRAMSYGTRTRRKSTHLPQDSDTDPTVIPSSSYLGFLERLPWRLGHKGLRYKPSAADLQEHTVTGWRRDAESEPLIEDSDESSAERFRARHTRHRSGTATSRSTTNSLSSRGDLIPSDEEEDAVPLDDEFAMALERRTTGLGSDDRSSGKTGSGRRSRPSQISTRAASIRSGKSLPRSAKSSARKDSSKSNRDVAMEPGMPSIIDLKLEEEQIRQEEEQEIERQREAAQKLAVDKGLESKGDLGNDVSKNGLFVKVMGLTFLDNQSPSTETKDPEVVKEVEVTPIKESIQAAVPDSEEAPQNNSSRPSSRPSSSGRESELPAKDNPSSPANDPP